MLTNIIRTADYYAALDKIDALRAEGYQTEHLALGANREGLAVLRRGSETVRITW